MYLAATTLPVVGILLIWQSYTARDILIFNSLEFKKSLSYESSTNITTPSAGDKYASGSFGIVRLGSRKKRTFKIASNANIKERTVKPIIAAAHARRANMPM